MSPNDLPILASDLRTVIGRLVKKMRSELPASGTLSLTERSVLKLLARQNALLPSELAAAEKVSTQSMSQILRHLEALSLIVREPSSQDGRKVYVELTPAGRNAVDAVHQEVDAWFVQALTDTCTPAELRTLQGSVTILQKVLESR